MGFRQRLGGSWNGGAHLLVMTDAGRLRYVVTQTREGHRAKRWSSVEGEHLQGDGGASTLSPWPVLCKCAKCPSPRGPGASGAGARPQAPGPPSGPSQAEALWGTSAEMGKLGAMAATLWPQCPAGRGVAYVFFPLDGRVSLHRVGAAATGQLRPVFPKAHGDAGPALPILPRTGSSEAWLGHRSLARLPGAKPSPQHLVGGTRIPYRQTSLWPPSPDPSGKADHRCSQNPFLRTLPQGVPLGRQGLCVWGGLGHAQCPHLIPVTTPWHHHARFTQTEKLKLNRSLAVPHSGGGSLREDACPGEALTVKAMADV